MHKKPWCPSSSVSILTPTSQSKVRVTEEEKDRSLEEARKICQEVKVDRRWCCAVHGMICDGHASRLLFFLQRMILQRLTSCCLMAESSCSPPRGRPTSTSTSPPCSPSSSPPHSTQGEFWHQSEKENICHPNHFPLFTFIFLVRQ